nr:MAG TPA: hypothetical protein [Caudoviricetes sp.]
MGINKPTISKFFYFSGCRSGPGEGRRGQHEEKDV